MKNVMKMLVVVVLGVSAQMHAAKVTNADTTFELYNKDDKAVVISNFRVSGGKILNQDFREGMYDNVLNKLNPFARAQIRVDDEKKFVIYMEVADSKGSFKRDFTIRPGYNTVFVSFTTAKDPSLYPQTGPLKGLLGKSESGLSLKKNLSSSQIQKGDKRSMAEKATGLVN